MKGTIGAERLCLREFCEGNLEGVLYYWEPWKICRKGSGERHLNRGPAVEPGRWLVYRGR